MRILALSIMILSVFIGKLKCQPGNVLVPQFVIDCSGFQQKETSLTNFSISYANFGSFIGDSLQEITFIDLSNDFYFGKTIKFYFPLNRNDDKPFALILKVVDNTTDDVMYASFISSIDYDFRRVSTLYVNGMIFKTGVFAFVMRRNLRSRNNIDYENNSNFEIDLEEIVDNSRISKDYILEIEDIDNFCVKVDKTGIEKIMDEYAARVKLRSSEINDK